MKFEPNDESGLSLNRQFEIAMAQSIIDGEYKPGETVPSVRDVAAEFDEISAEFVNDLARAYRALEFLGVLDENVVTTEGPRLCCEYKKRGWKP